jgi:hypothetical protein
MIDFSMVNFYCIFADAGIHGELPLNQAIVPRK